MGSWIESFLEFTKDRPSPKIFRKWTALSGIAAAAEQRVFMAMNGQSLYPNMYALLVGGPGVGKTIAIVDLMRIIRSANEALPNDRKMFLAPNDVSKASLIDAIGEAKRRIADLTGIHDFLEYNSLYIMASEFTAFLTEYAGDFVTFLTRSWDVEYFEEHKRTGGRKLIIPRPMLNMLGGTTPSALGSLLPEGAWDQGFAARTLMIYSGEELITDPFAELADPTTQPLYADLVSDFSKMMYTQGQFRFAPEALEAFRKWHLGGRKPVPTHPKLMHYNPRRSVHLAKLCMIFSLARSGELLITTDDLGNALDSMMEIEHYMPEIFKTMSMKGGDAATMKEAQFFIARQFMRENKPVAKHRLVQFINERAGNPYVLRIIENMVAGRMIQEVFVNNLPYYVPASPEEI